LDKTFTVHSFENGIAVLLFRLNLLYTPVHPKLAIASLVGDHRPVGTQGPIDRSLLVVQKQTDLVARRAYALRRFDPDLA
jgi:hypothetical protein